MYQSPIKNHLIFILDLSAILSSNVVSGLSQLFLGVFLQSFSSVLFFVDAYQHAKLRC